jgi:hypothetical protein
MFESIAARHARDLVEGQFSDPRPPRPGPAPRTRRARKGPKRSA